MSVPATGMAPRPSTGTRRPRRMVRLRTAVQPLRETSRAASSLPLRPHRRSRPLPRRRRSTLLRRLPPPSRHHADRSRPGSTSNPAPTPTLPPDNRVATEDYMALLNKVHANFDEGRLADAHRLLSSLYHNPTVPPEAVRQVNELLDQMAGAVDLFAAALARKAVDGADRRHPERSSPTRTASPAIVGPDQRRPRGRGAPAGTASLKVRPRPIRRRH